MIQVIIADDHRLVRQGISSLLTNAEGIEVIGEAEDGQEALELARQLQPDVLVLDISMPRMNGLEALAALPAEHPPVLFLSMHGDPNLVRRTLEAGAAGYVLKRAAGSELIAGITAVYSGNRFLSDGLRQHISA